MPVERAFGARDVYTELDCGVDKKYLEVYFETIEALLDKGKLSQAAALTRLARERTKDISNAMLLFKLASVVFVGEDEDPYRYDMQQAEDKIAFWIKNEDVERFFLNFPLNSYLTFLRFLDVSIASYFKVQGEQVAQALTYHISLLSEMPEKSKLKDYLQSQLQLIKALKV